MEDNYKIAIGALIILLLAVAAICAVLAIEKVQTNQEVEQLEEQLAEQGGRINELKEIIQEKDALLKDAQEQLDLLLEEEWEAQEQAEYKQDAQNVEPWIQVRTDTRNEQDDTRPIQEQEVDVEAEINKQVAMAEAEGQSTYDYIYNRYMSNPETREDYINWGRYLELNNITMAHAPSNPGIPVSASMEAAIALRDVYNSHRVTLWIQGRVYGYENSPYWHPTASLRFVKYIRERGRSWENALATMEIESTFGLGSYWNHYGILWRQECLYPSWYENTQHYCNYLDNFGATNDPLDHARKYNDHEVYWITFCDLVKQVHEFKP